MKINTIEDIVELCKKVNKKHRAFGGNCGSFALALARELSKQNIKCSLTVCSSIDEEDLEEMNYSPRAYEDFETDIYHVALYVGDTLVDGSGKISINDFNRSYWTIRFDDNTTLEMVPRSSLTPINDLDDSDCLAMLNLLNK